MSEDSTPVIRALTKMNIPHRFFRHPGPIHSLEQAAEERGQKLALVQQAEAIFVEDAPLWFFNYNKAILAHQPWVHGLAPVAPEMMFQDMTNVWIDESSPRANMK